MSRTQRENIFTQSTFQQKVWQTSLNVMDLYEKGQIKDQKLTSKQLTATPEFRQHLLQPIHNLNPDFQLQILSEVVTKKINLAELKDRANSYRKMETIKQAFVTCTKSGSWENATSAYPLHCTEERFKTFIHLNFQTIPDVFRHYCQSAVCSREGTHVNSHCHNGNFLAVAEESIIEVTGQQLKATIPVFNGAHLALVAISEVLSIIFYVH